MNKTNTRSRTVQTTRRTAKDRNGRFTEDNNDMNEKQSYAPYRGEHDEYRRDWNRNNYNYQQEDWNRTQNSNPPPYSERNEDWYRHTYGLPANGRLGQRRHDISQWGNPSYTQNTSNREYDRINNNFNQDEQRRQDNTVSNDYDNHFNRSGVGSYSNNDYNAYGEYAGAHRGKGPKGYLRSDERIREDINDRLTNDAHVDASNIEVSVEKGEVTLTGTVSERHSKRRAEDIAELVSGVTNVENRIRVK